MIYRCAANRKKKHEPVCVFEGYDENGRAIQKPVYTVLTLTPDPGVEAAYVCRHCHCIYVEWQQPNVESLGIIDGS